MRVHVWWVALSALPGCEGKTDELPMTTADTTVTTDTSTPINTGDTSDTTDTGATTGTTGDTAVDPIVDCTALPSAPLAMNQLEAPRAYHDVAFDTLGHLIGSDGNSLLQATYDGTVSVFVPSAGVVHGMDWLSDGDLAYADGVGSLFRVSSSGAPSLLVGASGGNNIYGVTNGPDGKVYFANWTTIQRLDPATGQQETILNVPNVTPYVLDFSPDHRKLYIGTIWAGGIIWVLDLDANLDPIGPPTQFAAIGSGALQLHDALAVDWCGNLYVAEYYTNNLYRISPEGEVSLFVDYSETEYGHGLEWGSGIGGWRADAVYVPQPYNGNRVMEIVIGVPSREWTGTSWPPAR